MLSLTRCVRFDGGDDWKTLYFTSRVHLGSVNVKIPGIPVPKKK